MTQAEIDSLIEQGKLPLASAYLFYTHLNLMGTKHQNPDIQKTYLRAVYRVKLEQLAQSTDLVAKLLGKNKRYFCGILIPVPGSKFVLMAGQSSEKENVPHLWFIPRGLYDPDFEPNATPVKYIEAFPQEISSTLEDKKFDALFVSDKQPLYEFLAQQAFFIEPGGLVVDGQEDLSAQLEVASIFLSHGLLELFHPGVLLNPVTQAQIILPGLMETLGRFLTDGRYVGLMRNPKLANTWAKPLSEGFSSTPGNRGLLSAWLSTTAKLTGTPKAASFYRKMADNKAITYFKGSALDQWRWISPSFNDKDFPIDDIWKTTSCLWDETEKIPALKRTIDGYALTETNPQTEKSGVHFKHQLTRELNPQHLFIEEKDALALVKEVNHVSGDDTNKMTVGKLSTYPPKLLCKFVERTAKLLNETIPDKTKEN